MMISATGRRTAESRGFTLLEVMLVLLLLSLSTMLVVANVTGTRYRAEQEGQRLADRLNGLARMAALEGKTYGLRVAADSWRLKVWRGRHWQDLTLPGGGDAQTLPSGWRLQLTISGVQTEDDAPQVLLLAGGEVTPFHLHYFYNDRPVAELVADEDGMITLMDGRNEAP